MNKSLSLSAVAVLAAILGGIAGAAVARSSVPSREELIAGFYRTENAVHVSPHSLRKKIQQGDTSFVLVDLRSGQEYEKEHVVGAVSIPAYKDPDHSAYDEADRIVSAFRALPQGKDVIVYCYSIPCMTGRKIGQMLAEHGVYVQHLGIGWNEWRHFWTLWNHEHEWSATKAEEYVARGKEPGTFKGAVTIEPCQEGQFGC